MKHLVTVAILIPAAVAALATSGCTATRQKEKTVSASEILATAEITDTMASVQTGNTTARNSEEKYLRKSLVMGTEAIAAASARLYVPIWSLLDLPDGAGYTAREGRADVALLRHGDSIEVTGYCDSVSRMYWFYRELSEKQRLESDSLRQELRQQRIFNAAQAAELARLQESASEEARKPPGRGSCILSAFIAGVAAGAIFTLKIKNIKR